LVEKKQELVYTIMKVKFQFIIMKNSSTKFIPILSKIKLDYETAITTAIFDGKKYANGNKAKEALIRLPFPRFSGH